MKTLVLGLSMIACAGPMWAGEPPGSPLSSLVGDATASFWTIRSKSRVALGLNFSCAVGKERGGVRCWGHNEHGVLGSGKSFEELAWSAMPVEVLFQQKKDRKPLSGILAVAAGSHHACALNDSGNVWCWGQAELGQLGDGPDPYMHRPAAVQVLIRPGEPLSQVRSIGGGSYHTCAVVEDGGVWCWGQNLISREPTRFATRIPGVDGASAVSEGGDRACAVIAGGAVTCWGRDGRSGKFFSAAPVPGIAGALSVVGGAFHHCALAQGEVFCWGGNEHGQLGNGEKGEGKDRWPPESAVVKVGNLGGRATTLAAGAFHTCATIGRQARCWGNNATRQALGFLGGVSCDAGSASFPCQPSPELVHKDGESAIANAVRVFGGGYHSCALVMNLLKCWGFNGFGQLGEMAPLGEGGVGPTEILKLE